MEIITRKEAKEQGLARYFTGRACNHGHKTYRYTSSGICIDCGKAHYDKSKNKKMMEVNVSWYEGIDYYFAFKNKLKAFDITCDDGKDFRPCKACGGTIKTTVRKRCIICTVNCRDGKYFSMSKNKRLMEIMKKSIKMVNKDVFQKRQAKRRAKNKKEDPVGYWVRLTLQRVMTNWTGKRADAEKLLGYSHKELVKSIEDKFQDGMSWANHSMHGWHIDHIKPVKAFLDEGITDPAIINALDNLQPLWASENLSKGAKWEE